MAQSKATFGQRVKSLFGRGGAEGSWRGPFSGIGEFGTAFTLGGMEDGWQRNLDVTGMDARRIPAAYASVMANARAVSQCSPRHEITSPEGKREISKTSPASRVLRKPNDYETWSQFITNMVAEMQFEGESFAVVTRDDRQAITALHRCPRRSASPYVLEDGTVMYSIGANPLNVEQMEYLVPAKDCLHLKSYCPRHPLMGESPIKAAAMAAGVNVALSGNQAAFFSQMSRPSGILSTDEQLGKETMEQLRSAWKDHSTRLAAGGIPILHSGLKWQPLTLSSQDSQLIEAQRLSIEDIARVFGVPLPVIGDMTNSTLANVEQLVSLWLSVSLGAMLENIEQSLERLFNLPQNEHIDFDVSALIRMDFEGRINGRVKAVQGALMTPNEARQAEGLSPLPHGDDLFLQAQMVALGTSPVETATPVAAPEPEQEPEEEQRMTPDDMKKQLRLVING
jgi:HK97 family phage portal protein